MLEICPHDKCTGCEMCGNICPRSCISFKQDEEGFFVPVIDRDNCINCQLCSKMCPANSLPAYHPEQKHVYAAWAADDAVRCASSSGGLYSVFADHVFSLGGKVSGVCFDDAYFAVHGLFDDPAALRPCRGSKYVQSLPGKIYTEVKAALDEGKTVLFTSTPCQVNALNKFLGKEYENLYTCDFVCHGVPSPQYLKNTLTALTGGIKEKLQITFRDLAGWGKFEINAASQGKCFNESAIGHSYIKTFLAGANYRYACYSCPFARNARTADITIGDFWGLGKYRLFFHDQRKGVSLLMLNSPKGRELFEKVRERLFFEKRSFKEAARENHQLRQNVPMPAARHEFYQDARKLSAVELTEKYAPGMPPVKKLLSLPGRAFNKLVRCLILCLLAAGSITRKTIKENLPCKSKFQ